LRKTFLLALFLLYLSFLFSESSYPYISGYTWWHFCHWKLTYPDYGKQEESSFDPEKVASGDTIFVEYDRLEEFAQIYLPKLSAKIILITANYGYHADLSLPGPFAFLLQEEKIAAWFVQNIDRPPNEKLIPIPIGLASSYWPHGNYHLIDAILPQALANLKRSIFIYLNFSLAPERISCINHFACMGVKMESPKPYAAYLQDLSQSVFVISPPGGGIDCHRTWEALLLGCYPVVKSSSLDPLFQNLPVVIVQDWEEVSFEFLEQKYHELKDKTGWRERLYSPYWFQKIYDLQSQIKAQNGTSIDRISELSTMQRAAS
jgi:hypothetical protein